MSFRPASRAGGNLRENRKPESRAVMWPKRYAKDMERAWNRVRAVPSAHIETLFGGLEYAQRGTGAPVLTSHGIWGSHAEGIGMVGAHLHWRRIQQRCTIAFRLLRHSPTA